MRKNILDEKIRRNGGVGDAQEYFGRVGTQKWRCRGCAEIFWTRRYVKMEVSRMRKNISVEKIRRDGSAKEYFG